MMNYVVKARRGRLVALKTGQNENDAGSFGNKMARRHNHIAQARPRLSEEAASKIWMETTVKLSQRATLWSADGTGGQAA